MYGLFRGRQAAVLELDCIAADPRHAAKTYDILDGPKRFDLHLTDGCAVEHCGSHRGIEPQEVARGLQTIKGVIHISGVRQGFHHGRLRADCLVEELHRRLRIAPVDEPGVAGNDPRDHVRVDPLVEQPETGVDPRFPGANNHEPLRRFLDLHKVIDGDEVDALIDLKIRGVGGRHRCLEVCSVHERIEFDHAHFA